MSNARPQGSSAASSCAEPAPTSSVPTATSTGARMAATSSRASVWREPQMQAASALRSDLVCSAKASGAPKPAARAIAFGDPFGRTLERGNKTEERHGRPEQPRREVEGAHREDDGAAARELEDRAGLAALGRSEARDPRHVARSFGEL